ncbi:MAG: carbohydrate ABC transporter permease [Christensenellales bacterium]|jgi:multiple sugar transport system permease protein
MIAISEKSIWCKTKNRQAIVNNWAGYLFIFPWLFGFFVFTLFPMLASLYLAFTKYDGFGTPAFIGLDNFRTMFSDPTFYTSLGVTFKYALLLVPFRLVFSLIVAMILSTRSHKGLGIYRTLFYVPSLLGGSVAIAIIWGKLFGADGAINSILQAVGLNITNSWVGEPGTALYVLILLGVWQFGSSMLIFVSGIKQIPQSYYEAALIDGASSSQSFFKITLPMLSPVIFFNLLMGIITAFKTFTESMIITNGGPFNKTLVYALYIYRQSFQYYKMGYACALSWVLLCIIGVVSIFVFRSSESWVYYESKGD